MKIRPFFAFVVIAAAMFILDARADTPNARDSDVAWFVGVWAVGAADRAGFGTIAGGPDCNGRTVRIVRAGATSITRISTLKSGERHEATFEVKDFRGSFPWWPVGDIGGPVARKAGADAFLLARTVNGKADWNNALKHIRCIS